MTKRQENTLAPNLKPKYKRRKSSPEKSYFCFPYNI